MPGRCFTKLMRYATHTDLSSIEYFGICMQHACLVQIHDVPVALSLSGSAAGMWVGLLWKIQLPLMLHISISALLTKRLIPSDAGSVRHIEP